MEVRNWSLPWAGRTLSVETGKFALQTNASCTVRYGDTVLLATVVMSKKTRDGMDFFPLTVNFEEKYYAAGKIKGSRFTKRESHNTDEVVLYGRLVDRAIRPLFDQSMRNEIQVVLTVLSYDGENDPRIPALIAASIVLSISSIPWAGPIGGVRVGRVNSEWKINPSFAERQAGDADIVVAGTPDKVVMVEAGCKDVPEAEVIEAMKFGCDSLAPVIEFIKKIQSEIGQSKIDLHANLSESEAKLSAVEQKAKALVESRVNDWIFDSVKKGRAERVALVEKFEAAIEEMLVAQKVEAAIKTVVLGRVKMYVEEYVSKEILESGRRIDGRSVTDIRPLQIETGLLPRTHGSGFFQRGDTQVLSMVTIGTPGDAQALDSIEGEGTKRYIHHYNDTPATYGDTGPLRGPGNRAVGHGALAERALEPVLPDEQSFPYVVRVVSEIFGSNGSSSMASTCGSTLALMDAGVRIKKPVAGIAMGLASEGKKWTLLTDLQDIEDGPGGMDFKITGTRDGVTAIQMDTKTDGLTWDIVDQTFARSKEARLKILAAMHAVIPEPRKEMSPYAPRVVTLMIHPEKVREVIGPGGKMIKKIIAETGVSMDIKDDGRITIISDNSERVGKAIHWVKKLTHEVTAGEIR
jgi:polyribonucleotide nucleotidyltransferase